MIMARYWYANKNLDPLFLLFASACAFMGIFPWIHTIFTQEYGFLLIPIILWAMYLVYWHIFNQQHVRPQRKYE
ncbi:hypothetical protein A3K93_00190 [Acinetobacter sp. NCu2D-2]|uniref:hypothetical protein n=1 Tax=Acinetobacter sp. NCu2D-2 TaxID=1608473 RepID=UPI0007CDECE0|nr:hypothetical protein [Acinetobacter sp. NCu2D-2]ANF80765.1 hypothetical protein A3K93_00190 [Acinetobacter sp. NCu2D-2]